MAGSAGRQAGAVAAGILLSRLLGFVRERVFAHYFGNGPAADAFRAALKIPNLLRNLLGEGTLSGSFIPVYARLLARGDEQGARLAAGAVASLLALVAAVGTAAGMLLAPLITDVVAPGFHGATRDLTVTLVTILFPMSGLTILSAWCLGVLNSHGRFFLSYAAPAAWNAVQIATLIAFGLSLSGARLAVALAWGAVLGSALQLLWQLPSAWRLTRGIAWSVSLTGPGVRDVVRGFGPMVFGAGVAQISGIVDTQLASLLTAGAVASLGYAQLLANLPVALFGVSIAAAALPELSRDAAGPGLDALRERLAQGARRVTFFVVPTALALGALGTPLVATLYQTGAFGREDTRLVAGVLAGYALGLPGQASVKLLASGFYAQSDTRSPVRAAALALVLSAACAGLLMRWLGPAGIALGASVGAWANTTLHLEGLHRTLGPILGRPERRLLGVSVLAAAIATVVSLGIAWLMRTVPPAATTAVILPAFATVYLSIGVGAGHPDAARLVGAARARLSRGSRS